MTISDEEMTRLGNLAFIREIDRLISEGKNEREIADSFGLSVSQYRIARTIAKKSIIKKEDSNA